MDNLMAAFTHETNEGLEHLDEILLESERDKNISEENINSIFRITHTIKGSAAMMELGGISSLAHAVEDVFYIIREDPQKLTIVFEALFDLVFQSSDFLKNEMEKLQAGGYVEDDPSALIAQLREQAAVMKGEASEAPAPAPAAAAPAAPAAPAEAKAEPAPEGSYRIRVFFEDDCQMENMRAL